ncbi:MAG: hypothetical protein V3U76_06455 [Granulosicoccus sp.]
MNLEQGNRTINLPDENGAVSDSASIRLYAHNEPIDRKIEYAIANNRVSANVAKNLEYMLSSRLLDKDSKFTRCHTGNEYWLAFLSEYWLANEESVQLAFDKLGIKTKFDRIYLIYENERVHQLK